MAKKTRSLTSDELGDLGESYFRSLIHPSVITNSSHPDKRGWDFFVEFKASEEVKAHKKFFIQVKTIWEDIKNVKGKLSSIKMIALNELPSGILVIKISADQEISSLHYIEFKDEALEHLLKRLTVEKAKKLTTKPEEKIPKLNNCQLSFSVEKYGIELPKSSFPLSDYLSDLFDDQFEYITKKNQIITKAGFEGGKVHLSIQSNAANFATELARISLGLDSFSPSKFDAYKTRFGFDLPDHEMNGADPNNIKITIGPSEPTPVKLRAESKEMQKLIELDGNLHFGFWDIPGQSMRPFMFINPTIKLVILNPDTFIATVDCLPTNERLKFEPYELEKYAWFRMILNQSDCKLTFINNRNEFVNFTLSDHVNPIDPGYFWQVAICSQAIAKLNTISPDKELKISVEDIFSNLSSLKSLVKHTLDPIAGNAFVFSGNEISEFESKEFPKGMIIEIIKINDDCFAIQTLFPHIDVIEESIRFNLENAKILNVSYLGNLTSKNSNVTNHYKNFLNLNKPVEFDGLLIQFESKDYEYLQV